MSCGHRSYQRRLHLAFFVLENGVVVVPPRHGEGGGDGQHLELVHLEGVGDRDDRVVIRDDEGISIDMRRGSAAP